jgi:hypothetical protein
MAAVVMAIAGGETNMSKVDYLQTAEDQVKATELPQPVNASEWLDTEPPEPDQIIEDVVDVKDKMAIIGSSKLRKTFFLLQLLLCIASGKPFLSWTISKPRRILHIQYEIQGHHYHRRLRNMAKALNITPADLGDRFQIINARGQGLSGLDGIEKIAQIAKVFNPEIISFDPLYKVSAGAENDARDTKIILDAFDRLAEETKAAIFYIHHDAKGFSGDRDIRDRGAGSNVLGRDYDACIALTPHVAEPTAAVVETLLRNYRPQEPFVALWAEDDETGGYCFELAVGIAPTKKTSANSRGQDLPSLDSYLPAAKEILKEKPLAVGVFTDLFRTKTGATVDRTKAFKTWATSGPICHLDTIEKRSRGVYEKLIGIPEQIHRLKMERGLK